MKNKVMMPAPSTTSFSKTMMRPRHHSLPRLSASAAVSRSRWRLSSSNPSQPQSTESASSQSSSSSSSSSSSILALVDKAGGDDSESIDTLFDALVEQGRTASPILQTDSLVGNYEVAWEAPSAAQGKSRPAGGKFTSGVGAKLFPSSEKRQDIAVSDDGELLVRNWIAFDLLGILPGSVELKGRVRALINLDDVPPAPPPKPVDPDDEPIMVRARKLAASWQQAKVEQAEIDGKPPPPPPTQLQDNNDDWEQSDPGLEARALKTLEALGDNAPKVLGVPTLGTVRASTHALVAFTRPSIRLGFLPPFNLGPPSRVLLSVPYLDKRLRLGLGGRGSRFVFRRVGDDDDDDDVQGADPERDAQRAAKGRERAMRRLSTIASAVACAAIFGGSKWLVLGISAALGWGILFVLWRGGQVSVARKRRAERRIGMSAP